MQNILNLTSFNADGRLLQWPQFIEIFCIKIVMIETKFRKMNDAYDGMDRCQGVIPSGQCQYIAISGSEFCQHHQGNNGKNLAKRNYHLSKWQARVNQFADNDQVKSLREEIGVLRMVMEEILNKCHDSDDILLYSSKISDHILKIEKVVTSCHRLEERTSFLLDKTSILQIATTFVEIIGRHISDTELVDRISDEMARTCLAQS